MKTFKELPVGAVVFMGGLLVRKTGDGGAVMALELTRGKDPKPFIVVVNPDQEFESLKSVNIQGRDGSGVKMKF